MFSVKTFRWWNHGTVILLVLIVSGLIGWGVDARKISGEVVAFVVGFLVLWVLVKIENLTAEKQELEGKVKSLEAVVLKSLGK